MRVTALLLFLATLLLLLPLSTATALPLPAHGPGEALFGVINDEGGHYDDEWARGVRATTLELHWFLYEPQEGVYDAAYASHKQDVLASLVAQGWHVQLVPGIQYTPDWVFETYPDMRYVNQYGEAYIPQRRSFRAINAPFNPQARELIAGYVARIFQDFEAAHFDSVRVGGGVQGELRYPPPDWNDRHNSYWAFDDHAQTPSESGIPQDIVGWRPGLDPNPGSIGHDQLIVNPGFELTHNVFAIPGWSPDYEISAALTTMDPQQGARALQVTVGPAQGRIHQYVRVQANTAYEFGGWLRADGDGRARIFFTQIDAGNDVVTGDVHGQIESSGTAWTAGAGTLTTTAETRFLKVEMDGSETGTFTFDELWLREAGAGNEVDREMTVPLGFYDWYVGQLTAYQNWQIATIRQYYDGQLDLIYPGKGLLPNQATDAITNDLRGDGWSESSRALYSGTDYGRHVAGLSTTENVALYLTGIEEPAPDLVDDEAPTPNEWSAARWLAHLAQGKGMPIWGENGGQNTPGELQLVAQRMHDNNFLGLMWAFESELYADPNPQGYASIEDYESIIRLYNNPWRAYLPLSYRQ